MVTESAITRYGAESSFLTFPVRLKRFPESRRRSLWWGPQSHPHWKVRIVFALACADDGVV